MSDQPPTTSRRFRDVLTHQKLYPRHNVQWHDGEPHYCSGDHERGESCDWQPVPHYGKGETCEA